MARASSVRAGGGSGNAAWQRRSFRFAARTGPRRRLQVLCICCALWGVPLGLRPRVALLRAPLRCGRKERGKLCHQSYSNIKLRSVYWRFASGFASLAPLRIAHAGRAVQKSPRKIPRAFCDNIRVVKNCAMRRSEAMPVPRASLGVRVQSFCSVCAGGGPAAVRVKEPAQRKNCVVLPLCNLVL
jgi:hypothetical protein